MAASWQDTNSTPLKFGEIMATYNIGQGQTYETFASLPTLQPADVVNGGDNTFSEQWTLGSSGLSEQLITLKDSVINGEETRDNCVYVITRSFFSLDNLHVKDATARNINISLGLDAEVKNCSSDGADYGLYASSVTNFTAEDFLAINASIYACYIKSLGGLIIKGLNSDDTCDGGLWVAASSGLIDISNVRAILGALSTRYGLRLNDVSAAAGSIIRNSIFGGSDAASIWIDDVTDLTFRNVEANDSVSQSGVSLGGVSSNIVFEDCKACRNGNDGFSASESVGTPSDITYTRCEASGNGTSEEVGSGDGFTAHGGVSGLVYQFCKTSNNGNDAFGIVGAAAGKIYHHTSFNDGDNDIYTGRAVLFLQTSGALEIYNSVFCNFLSYKLGLYGVTPNITADYNAYISTIAPDGACFEQEGGTDKTWAQWVAVAGEAHSLYIYKVRDDRYEIYLGSAPTEIDSVIDYCPIAPSGKLVRNPDNPLIGAGVVITGVNDGAQTDHDGSPLRGNIDIGAFQYKQSHASSSILKLK